MPSILKHIECRSCGHTHHFCLIDGQVMPGADYNYVCPETCAAASLHAEAPSEEIRHYPQGAVRLLPTASHQAVA